MAAKHAYIAARCLEFATLTNSTYVKESRLGKALDL
jgi:hypothetical protein